MYNCSLIIKFHLRNKCSYMFLRWLISNFPKSRHRSLLFCLCFTFMYFQIVFGFYNDSNTLIIKDLYLISSELTVHENIIGNWIHPSGSVDREEKRILHSNKILLSPENFSINKIRTNWTGIHIRCTVLPVSIIILLKFSWKSISDKVLYIKSSKSIAALLREM